MRRLVLVLVVALGSLALVAANGSADRSHAKEDRLDCGSSKHSAEQALRDFLAILTEGRRAEIRAVLVDRPRFAWISAQAENGPPNFVVRKYPNQAARAIANRGGLPLEITEFGNSEKPARQTDFGFKGTWKGGARGMNGKGALDCKRGQAIALSVAVHEH